VKQLSNRRIPCPFSLFLYLDADSSYPVDSASDSVLKLARASLTSSYILRDFTLQSLQSLPLKNKIKAKENTISHACRYHEIDYITFGTRPLKKKRIDLESIDSILDRLFIKLLLKTKKG
jgi:hypothetical protein